MSNDEKEPTPSELLDALAAERERLAAVLASQLDPYVRLEAVRDEHGIITDLVYVELTDSACLYNKLEREQTIGRTMLELFPGQFSNGAFAMYVQTIETGEPMEIINCPYYNEAREEHIRVDIRAVRAGDGVGITFRDVTKERESEEQSLENERLYRLLAENSTDAVLLADNDFTVLWASASSEKLLGEAPENLVGSSAVTFFHPDDLVRILAAVGEAGVSGEEVRIRYRWLRTGEGYVWLETSAKRLPPEKGGQWVVAIRDVDAEVRAQHELKAREEQYRLLAENVSDLVWQIDPQGVITWASESMTRVLGWQQEEIVGKVAMELLHADDLPLALANRAEALAGRTTYGEYRLGCADGSFRWMGCTIKPYPTSSGTACIDSLRDIQEEVATRGELIFATRHDHLTKLPTMQAALIRVEDFINDLGPGESTGLLCVGIDNLATFNDAFTYAGGDQVLTSVASLLTETIGDPGLLGRGTGDEFLVLIPKLTDVTDAADLAGRIHSAVAESLLLPDFETKPTVSIGIAVGAGETTPLNLLGDAGIALRQAKQNGRSRFEFVDLQLAAQSQARLHREASIQRGLDAGEIEAWYQPIVSMRSGRTVGYEALARWDHEGTPVLPGEFLPLAEKSQLIVGIDIVILRQALKELAHLTDGAFMSANASAFSLASQVYADEVEEALRTSGADPSLLHLEVTETALLDNSKQVRATMTRLADLGVRWYVDDFGTGYSSISHLRDLPVSGLKLDLSFTKGIGAGDVTSVRLAQGLAGLAAGLGLDTIAEGVETEFEASILNSQGWRSGQGWLYGRPAKTASATHARALGH